MKKKLFKKGIFAIAAYVVKALKEEIKDQLDLVTISDEIWGSEEHHCNFNVAVEHLKIVIDFVWWFYDGGEMPHELKEGMYFVLYDEPYYKFNITEIIENSEVEVDANEFNKTLISYLKE